MWTIAFLALYYASLVKLFTLLAVNVVVPIMALVYYWRYDALVKQSSRSDNALFFAKILTFYASCLAAIYIYLTHDEASLFWFVNVLMRLQIVKVMIYSFNKRGYQYAIMGLPLVFLPVLHTELHEFYIFKITNLNYYFVIYYTLYVLGALVSEIVHYTPAKFMHPIIALFVPIEYWGSFRSFTGLYCLLFLDLAVVDRYLNFRDYRPYQKVFASYYNPLFVMVALAMGCHYVFNHGFDIY